MYNIVQRNQQSYTFLFNMSPLVNIHAQVCIYSYVPRSSLHPQLSRALRRVFWGILSHAFLREPITASTESCDEVQTSASKVDQTQNSIGFKSGD